MNVRRSNLYCCHEGVIETDRFQPSPLFINLQLTATDTIIAFSRPERLFQVQPIHRTNYEEAARSLDIREGFDASGSGAPVMQPGEWAGFRQTIRTSQRSETHRLGDYAAMTRKRSKGRP